MISVNTNVFMCFFTFWLLRKLLGARSVTGLLLARYGSPVRLRAPKGLMRA